MTNLVLCPDCKGSKASVSILHRSNGSSSYGHRPCSTCADAGQVEPAVARAWKACRRRYDERVASGKSLDERAAELGMTPRDLSDLEHYSPGKDYSDTE